MCYRYYEYSQQNHFAGSAIAPLNKSLHFRLISNHGILDLRRIFALQVRKLWLNSPFTGPNIEGLSISDKLCLHLTMWQMTLVKLFFSWFYIKKTSSWKPWVARFYKMPYEIWFFSGSWTSINPAHNIEAYSEPCQISRIVLLAEICNGWKPLTSFTRSSILDVYQGSEYVSGIRSDKVSNNSIR